MEKCYYCGEYSGHAEGCPEMASADRYEKIHEMWLAGYDSGLCDGPNRYPNNLSYDLGYFKGRQEADRFLEELENTPPDTDDHIFF